MAESPVAEVTPKKFHVFINYRVASDAALAEKICDKLQQLEVEKNVRVKCFLDKQNIRDGEDWEQEFRNGLKGACLFLAIVSRGAIEPISRLDSTRQDNVLLEYEMALKMKEEGNIDILPLMIGDHENGAYRKFGHFGMFFPNEPSKTAGIEIKKTMSSLFQLQGIFVNPDEITRYMPSILERLSTVWTTRFRDRWEDQSSLGPEEQFECVQCGEMFRESENSKTQCSYHESCENRGRYPCCNQEVPREPPRTTGFQMHGGFPGQQPFGQQAGGFGRPGFPGQPGFGGQPGFPQHGHGGFGQPQPVQVDIIRKPSGCQKNRHRAEHHNDYAYSKKYDWMGDFMNYTDKRTEWVEIKDTDMNSRDSAEVSAGYLMFGNMKNKLYIRVWGSPKLFISSQSDLSTVAVGNQALQFYKHEYKWGGSSSGEWVVADEKVTGLILRVKAPTSQSEEALHIDFTWGEDGVPSLTSKTWLSRGGIQEKKPSRPYDLPTEVYIKGPTLPRSEPDRKPREWPTTGNLPIKVKLHGGFCANPQFASQSVDYMQGAISLINLSKDDDISFLEIKGHWRVEGEEEWREAKMTTVMKETREEPNATITAVPFNLAAKAVGVMWVDMHIADPTKPDASGRWFNRAWAARFKPIQLRVTLEDVEGRFLQQVIEFVNPPHLTKLTCRESDRSFFLFADNVKSFDRSTITVKDADSKPSKVFEVRMPGRCWELSEDHLRTMVFKALQNGQTEVPFEDDYMQIKNDEVTIKGWALIDLKLQRVYGIKWTMLTATCASGAVYPVPMYGTNTEEADPSPATETPLESILEGYSVEGEIVKIAKPGVDEEVTTCPRLAPPPPVPAAEPMQVASRAAAAAPAAAAPGATGGASVASDEVMARLAKLEALAVEQSAKIDKLIGLVTYLTVK